MICVDLRNFKRNIEMRAGGCLSGFATVNGAFHIFGRLFVIIEYHPAVVVVALSNEILNIGSYVPGYDRVIYNTG